MKKKIKFPKTFSTEKEFKNYLKSNKDYVLNVLSDNQFLWKEDRYVCDSNILIFALRYALGRKTGAVQRIVDWVLEEWDRITPDDREFIVKEIIEFERHYGNLGFEWQRELWYRIVNKHLFGFIDEIK
jgi:hypothetical protein